ncbi:hypothetical protein NC653_004036 [Populus alba x Populus x berolinensis]|uniref:Uncharacterized protein n=2 Tax=Populus alba x Populus x berolinensis TaxID=444605 RepID=A0AAD6WJW8_9ROSI|nr:hypothetical protein NC653_004036 [Populus alba x Populus x berolinensis]
MGRSSLSSTGIQIGRVNANCQRNVVSSAFVRITSVLHAHRLTSLRAGARTVKLYKCLLLSMEVEADR